MFASYRREIGCQIGNISRNLSLATSVARQIPGHMRALRDSKEVESYY